MDLDDDKDIELFRATLAPQTLLISASYKQGNSYNENGGHAFLMEPKLICTNLHVLKDLKVNGTEHLAFKIVSQNNIVKQTIFTHQTDYTVISVDGFDLGFINFKQDITWQPSTKLFKTVSSRLPKIGEKIYHHGHLVATKELVDYEMEISVGYCKTVQHSQGHFVVSLIGDKGYSGSPVFIKENNAWALVGFMVAGLHDQYIGEDLVKVISASTIQKFITNGKTTTFK